VAERAREAGLEPAGDDGTYFQWWPMRRLRVSDASRAALGGEPLGLGRDAVVASPPVAADVDLPLVWVGDAGPDSLRRLDLRGRAAAALVTRPASPPVSWISLRPWRYARLALAERAAALKAAGAAAAVLVADDSTDGAFATVAGQLRRGTYGVDTAGSDRVAPAAAAPWPATVWVPAALGARVRAPPPPARGCASRCGPRASSCRAPTWWPASPGATPRCAASTCSSAATTTTTACAARCRWATTAAAAWSTRCGTAPTTTPR
jgi:hypothetical protein